MNGATPRENPCRRSDPGFVRAGDGGAFYGPLGKRTIPPKQRAFATHDVLPHYAERIRELRTTGAKLAVIFGIGRVCHIAFWERTLPPKLRAMPSGKRQTHRLGAKLHPLTIEQNAITSFKSRTTLVPAFANTIGPGPFPWGGQDHRWLRRRVRSRHDVAGLERG